MNLNIKAQEANRYDAIVIGSDLSGGWAAKELTQKGLRTLVLERGRDVEHPTDYLTTMAAPWEVTHQGRYPLDKLTANPVQSKADHSYNEFTGGFYLDDL